ncbi:MAG: hypothetical protein QXD23_00555 [Candidatus Micrarchaeaceae archaeon]
MASIEDLSKLDLRIGRIKNAEEIKGARSSVYKLEVYLGEEIGTRTIVAGIKNSYAINNLLNKQILCIINLEPKKIANVFSQGMILATGEGNNIILISPEKEVMDGSIVR